MEIFNEIFITNGEKVTQEELNSLIMCGTKNWEYFLYKAPTHYDEKLENVTFIEFEDEEKMYNFIKNNDERLIDYSLEHEKPCVLIKN